MKIHSKRVGFLFMAAVMTFSPLVMSAEQPVVQKSNRNESGVSEAVSQVAQGRYLVMVGGCNDCHTHMYMQLHSKVPESNWLTGDSIGWCGPWGTTYPANLRLFINSLSEDAWVRFSRTAEMRPAMPWWSLHEMREQDLRAIFLFIRHLGSKGINAPEYLPPDQQPKPPYFQFVPLVTKE